MIRAKHLLRRLYEARNLFALGLGLVLFLAALWTLHHELASVHVAHVMSRLREVPLVSIGLAMLFTTASYLALTGYDASALHTIGRRLPFARVATTAFTATAIGHNLGVAMISGGAVRLRMYSVMGLSATEVATLVGMVGFTFGIGVSFVLALVFIIAPAEAALLLHIPEGVAQLIGIGVLGLLGAYLIWGQVRQTPLHIGAWQIRVPGVATSLTQIGLATADLTCAAAVLFVLLPTDLSISYPLFLSVYVLAIVAGIISHVPGGIGVFETVLLLALPDAPRDGLLAAVLMYRLIYYLLPLGLAVALAAIHELRAARGILTRSLGLTQDALEAVVPQTMAVMVFIAGAILLFSGATPALDERLVLLKQFLPLPLLELSHLTASFMGLGLTVLSGALYRRINAAYHLAFWLLIAGGLASLGKGLDWEEALLSGFALSVLWASRAAFKRPASLLEQRLSAAWIAAICIALFSSLWLGLFVYKRVEYTNELWWQFAFDGEAPRFLRTTLVVVLSATALALLRLLRPAPPPPGRATQEELARAAMIVARSPASDAALALLGDKRLLFDPEDQGFLMFQIRGRSWIVMGDPVAPAAVAESLAWQFRELCDRYAGRPVFYQVDAEHLPLYLDLGLAPLKIGEEAIVDLTGFSLAGSHRAELRQVQRKLSKAGVRFEVVSAQALDDALMSELKSLSETWLAEKHTREKGFALGRFDPDYLRNFSMALVRQGEKVIAFANLWTGSEHAELSIDLMRSHPDAPKGVMDYLIAELMLWGAAQGFRRFNLGMAPLSGLEDHALAPLWHRIGTLVFQHGEHFYNFEGLRAYKEKFHPQWTPKYLAIPRGLHLPAVLLDVAALIGGGLKGVLTK